MKKILFATGNRSKKKRFEKGLMENGIEVISLKDIDLKLEFKENGKTAIENALIKAREGFKKSHIPTIGMDDTLYLENVPEEEQPGLFVRRVNGKTLKDDEIFVLGNNRLHSTDSRALGNFSYDDIVGKKGLVVFPFNNMKFID